MLVVCGKFCFNIWNNIKCLQTSLKSQNAFINIQLIDKIKDKIVRIYLNLSHLCISKFTCYLKMLNIYSIVEFRIGVYYVCFIVT